MTVLNIKNLLKMLTEDPTFVITVTDPSTFNRIKLQTKSYGKRDQLVEQFKAAGCVVTVKKI
jgi:hypothetical protein